MTRTRFFFRRTAFIAIAAGVGLPVSATAQASKLNNPIPTKVFYACYIPSSGVTYRIKESDLKQTCSSADHVMFSWTDGGTPGPQCPVGPQGATGPQGPQGAPGVGGFTTITRVQSAEVLIPAGQSLPAHVDCPAGTKAIGGGYAFGLTGNKDARPLINWSDSQGANMWGLNVSNFATGAGDVSIIVVAYCIS